MKPIEIIASDLFDKVRSRFTNLQMGDESGSVTADPAAARFFDFDFAVEGVTLGRISISINEIGSLKIFYSQGITENTDGLTQTMWYDFLKEMRFFAKRRLLRFDTRDITKDNLNKDDFQYLAQNGPKDNNEMNESALTGSSRTSHRKLENTDLIIRHSEPIDPNQKGSRSRKIKNLFIQNSEGERFKFPFTYLPGARAMQRHVANGGYPHDAGGQHIVKCCEEILKLSDFGRKVKHSTLNDNAHGIIERAGQKLKQLRHHMECMGKQGYYESWAENYKGEEANVIEMDDATMESYKDAFTVNKFDEALAEVFPLLHAIMQEAGEIDLDDVMTEAQDEEIEVAEDEEDKALEFAAFESWATSVQEGTMAPEVVEQLKQLMATELQLGASGELVSTLQGIGVEDENLFSVLGGLSPNASSDLIKQNIISALEESDPELAQELAGAAQPQEPAMDQQAPAEMPPEEAPVAEDPNKSDIPAFKRKQQGGDWKVSQQDLEKQREKNISDPKTLAKNSGRTADEDHVEPGDDKDNLIEKGSNEAIWQAVEGFLDKEKGTWTKGRPGIVAHCSREFGEEGGKRAAKAIMILSKKYPMRDEPEIEGAGGFDPEQGDGGGAGAGDIQPENEMVEKLSAFEDIMRLAGLTKKK